MPRNGTLGLIALLAGCACVLPGGAAAKPWASSPLATDSPAATSAARVRVVRGAGTIRPAVNLFRRLLGRDNGVAPGGHAKGRREINWDGVPDEFAAPHALPGDFFNRTTAPRARGAVLSTPGDHVAVSADASNPDGAPVRFGDVNPTYSSQFKTFSAERLFSPIGSNIVDLGFRVPGTSRRAVVRGFGAVYTGVDRRETTAFRYYDARDRLIGTFRVPVSRNGLSFLGVRFPTAVVARVRIAYGSVALGPDDDAGHDVAVMDDFVYGEPQPAP